MPQLQIYWDISGMHHFLFAAYEKADSILNICILFSALENNFQSKETFKKIELVYTFYLEISSLNKCLKGEIW